MLEIDDLEFCFCRLHLLDGFRNLLVVLRTRQHDNARSLRIHRYANRLARHQRQKDGCVFGYQCEIDPSERAWSGGIYDESRRGWLNDLKDNEAGRKAFKPNGWNQFVIKAQGSCIKTWINGVPCADLTDEADAEGFIALQVHAGKEGQIRWRNIRIKPL